MNRKKSIQSQYSSASALCTQPYTDRQEYIYIDIRCVYTGDFCSGSGHSSSLNLLWNLHSRDIILLSSSPPTEWEKHQKAWRGVRPFQESFQLKQFGQQEELDREFMKVSQGLQSSGLWLVVLAAACSPRPLLSLYSTNLPPCLLCQRLGLIIPRQLAAGLLLSPHEVVPFGSSRHTGLDIHFLELTNVSLGCGLG